MQKSNLKAIFFDLDDTLFDRTEAQRQVLHLIIQKYNVLFAEFDAETVIKAFRQADEVGIKAMEKGCSLEQARVIRGKGFLKILNLDEAYSDEITEMYLNLYPSLNIAVDGVHSVLEKLSDKFQLGMITNGSTEVQNRKTNGIGIKDFFECIIISDEIGCRKPDPRIFETARKLLSREPEECMHIGDSYNSDVIGAKNAGFFACWINPNGKKPSQMDIKPDYVIKSLCEILKFDIVE